MADLASILADPNYINANDATKRAIFDRFSAQDPNFTRANPATQDAIRVKFGVAVQPLREDAPKTIPPPQWAKEYPSTYKAAVTARQILGPTAEMLGGVAGGAGGAAGGFFGAGPVGAAVGGVAGAGLGYGTVKQALRPIDVALGLARPDTAAGELARAASNVIEGATMEAGGRVAAPVLNKLIGLGAAGVGKLADVNQLPKQLAAKTARESFKSPADVALAKKAMQSAQAQGLDLTAQQALARADVVSPSAQATIEKAIAKTAAVDVRAAKEAAQEVARKATIKGITPDLASAIATRQAAAQPFYKAADEAVVPIDKELADIISRMPNNTLAIAANIAKMEGRPFIMGTAAPAQAVPTGLLDAAGRPITKAVAATEAEITGESLHYIRRALSDVAYGPAAATGAGRDTQLAAKQLLKDYVTAFESRVPDYAAARQIYANLSAPVNQAQVLREMVSVLEKPGGGERIGPFLNVLGRGEEAMLKRAGGRGAARFESLDEVLTPDQLSKVQEVAKQLETQTKVSKQITGGQQRASDLLKEELPNYRLPNIFNVLATTANRVLDTLGVAVGRKTIEKLADAALSARSFDELLGTLPAVERNTVLKALSNPATWGGMKLAGPAIMGTTAAVQNPRTPVNSMAPSAEIQNNLVEQ